MSQEQNKEAYYFGQGKVFLSFRSPSGQALARRWVGDVSECSLSLNVENIDHKESYSGNRARVRRLTLGRDGELSMKWHQLSSDNLALLFHGTVITYQSGTVTDEPLPSGIKAGERYTLEHIQVSNVVLTAKGKPLVVDTDYYVDEKFGAVEFLTDQVEAPKAAYAHKESQATALFTNRPVEMVVRYEGVNLAEGGVPVVMELYKVQFDPTSVLNLINSDNNFAGLDTKAGVLMDTLKNADEQLGMFGYIKNVESAS